MRDSTEEVHGETKMCSAEVQGSGLVVHPPHSTDELEFHHPEVTADKAAWKHDFPYQLFLGEHKVQHGASPSWFPNQMYGEVVFDTSRIVRTLLCCSSNKYHRD